jgi:transposase-like protein
MLAELSVVEQRYLAVREALDIGATITDVASRYGVDRRTVHRWLTRYAAGGLGALADRSSKPDRCPHQIPPEVEARIVALRRTNPGWGPRTILSKLRASSSCLHPARPSTAAWCGIASSLPSPAGAGCRTTSAGSGNAPWSCGRSTSWSACASSMGSSCGSPLTTVEIGIGAVRQPVM